MSDDKGSVIGSFRLEIAIASTKLASLLKKKQDGERGEGIEEEQQKLHLPSFFFCIGIPFLVHHHAKLFVTQLVVLKSLYINYDASHQ